MPLNVIITRDYDHLSEVAAHFIQHRLLRILTDEPSANLGLATGSSPAGTYKHLAKAVNNRLLDPARIRTFNLDEYIGLPGANAQARALHPESYTFFMIQELFGLLKTKFAETHVPPGCLVDQPRLVAELDAHPADWHEEGADAGRAIVIHPDAASPYLRWIRTDILDAYEQLIRDAGGIHLALIGMGERGHVAFHEVGIPFPGNRMLLVKLDQNTIDNAVADGHFCAAGACPRYAVSMGAELVFEAPAVLLLASGARKAAAVAGSLLRDPADALPVSYGQLHARRGGDVTYILDLPAAANLLPHLDALESRGIHLQDLSNNQPRHRLEELAFRRDPGSGKLV